MSIVTVQEFGSSGVHPGDVLAGKYRVDRILGEGGMGVVVAAHHIQLDERVAIKFLVRGAMTNAEAVARFDREARAAVKIKSEHVARVIDVGRLESGAPYMVMEYLEGGDLAAWLSARGPLQLDQAVEFILQACEALAEAHVLGIIHRDLKPANLFCVRRSDGQLTIKVLDFGISKLTAPDVAGGSNPSLTRTSATMGTPIYMSPEQVRSSRSVDARTDIWALGVILYELLAGRPPFHADSMMELAVKIATEPLPRLSTLRADVPPGLEAVIGRCTEKDPNRRFSHVGELALALVPFAPRRAHGSVDRISGILHAAGLSKSDLSLESPPWSGGTYLSPGTAPALVRTTAGRRPSRFAGVPVAAVGALALAAAAFLARRPAPPLGAGPEATGATAQASASHAGVPPPAETTSSSSAASTPGASSPAASALSASNKAPPSSAVHGGSAGRPPPRPRANPLDLPFK
jgi:serine/threonine-protein kinase